MGEPQRIPRRPAILDYAQTEAIVGAPDVADSSVLAHSTAWALLGVGDEDFDAEALRRLRELLSTGGVPLVAELWSQSPDFTLPGALWRVYLFREWFHRDPLTVADLYILGLHAEQVPGLEEPIHARPLEDVIHDADALLSGEKRDDDLEDIFTELAHAMRIVAAGDPRVGRQWIDDPHDALAFLSTVFPYSLEAMAMKRVSAATFALFTALLPATSALIGAVLLRQIPSLWQLVGLVCISIAVGIASMAGRAHPDVKSVQGTEETEN